MRPQEAALLKSTIACDENEVDEGEVWWGEDVWGEGEEYSGRD